MSLKPIVHGGFDPTEVPYYCSRCVHYQSKGFPFPRCTKREDGKFKPDIEHKCLKLRPVKEDPVDKL